MLDNLPNTITNFPFIYSIKLSYEKNDKITSFCILFVFTFSFLSHLIENHKHCMYGIYGVNKNISYILNRFDVLGCILVFIRFSYLIYRYKITFTIDELFLFTVSILLNLISELDKDDIEFKWKVYIPIHSIWHLFAARNTLIFLNKVYIS